MKCPKCHSDNPEDTKLKRVVTLKFMPSIFPEPTDAKKRLAELKSQ